MCQEHCDAATRQSEQNVAIAHFQPHVLSIVNNLEDSFTLKVPRWRIRRIFFLLMAGMTIWTNATYRRSFGSA
ncbi:hypothetical protein MES4922_300227 [Mesorhizobium ventifaucium]|uniref:Uncharacterized protein n=1 Tax=Mesorhizobium ventifaucium TaxID=666020 RepID=A0ABN8JYL4_9HYPH|nr:hypothetical protein MES4922_300227 [Mesorhizobium ventifaucium]